MNKVNVGRTVFAGTLGCFSKNVLIAIPLKYHGYQLSILTGSLAYPIAITIFSSFISTLIIQNTGILKEDHVIKREFYSLAVTVITTIALSWLAAFVSSAALPLGSIFVASSLLGVALRITTIFFENLYCWHSFSNRMVLESILKNLEGKFKGFNYSLDQGLHLPASKLDKIIFQRDEENPTAVLRVNHLFFEMEFEPTKKIKASYYHDLGKGNDYQAKVLWSHENIYDNKKFLEGMNETKTKDRCFESGLPLALEIYLRLFQAIEEEIIPLKSLTIKNEVIKDLEDLKNYVGGLKEKFVHTIACWNVITNVFSSDLCSTNIANSGFKDLVNKWKSN